MAIAFNSSGDDVMTRQIAAYSQPSFTNIPHEFDISSTATWIREHNLRTVCITLDRIS